VSQPLPSPRFDEDVNGGHLIDKRNSFLRA
jgi:hypothetical protein